MIQIRNALKAIGTIKELCTSSGQQGLGAIGEQLNPCHTIAQRISSQLRDEASVLGRGDTFATGADAELDHF